MSKQSNETHPAFDSKRCGFCYPREHGKNGEVKREWAGEWGQMISVCRKHSFAGKLNDLASEPDGLLREECERCGGDMDSVRPGKIQCPQCS